MTNDYLSEEIPEETLPKKEGRIKPELWPGIWACVALFALTVLIFFAG